MSSYYTNELEINLASTFYLAISPVNSSRRRCLSLEEKPQNQTSLTPIEIRDSCIVFFFELKGNITYIRIIGIRKIDA
jgi:hypothetical protein